MQIRIRQQYKEQEDRLHQLFIRLVVLSSLKKLLGKHVFAAIHIKGTFIG